MKKEDVLKVCNLWIEGFDALQNLIAKKESNSEYNEELNALLKDALEGNDRKFLKEWISGYVLKKLKADDLLNQDKSMKKEIKEQLMQSELFRNEAMISDATDCIYPGYIHHVGDTYWGKSLYIMEERGYCLIRVSWYEDEQLDTAFIEGLSVSFKYRKLGYGSSLMDMAENVCRALGRRYAILGVVRGSWQEQWYRRRGYKDCDYWHEGKELIMLRKNLNE